MVSSTRSRRRAVARARLHRHHIMHRSRLCHVDDRLRRGADVGRAVERNELDGRAGTGRHVPERGVLHKCDDLHRSRCERHRHLRDRLERNGLGGPDDAQSDRSHLAVLNGVFCASATSCEAVGSYIDSTSQQHTLAEGYAAAEPGNVADAARTANAGARAPIVRPSRAIGVTSCCAPKRSSAQRPATHPNYRHRFARLSGGGAME